MDDETATEPLRAVGVDSDIVERWLRTRPGDIGGFVEAARAFSEFWRQSAKLLARLPTKPRRKDSGDAAAEVILQEARRARARFLAAHVAHLYDALTECRSCFLSLSDLLAATAAAVPGLVPTPEEVAAENRLPLSAKSGVEIDQGLFLSAVLGSEVHGRHLCHAMLLPRREAVELAPKLAREGLVDLGGASVERQGPASIVTMRNPRRLNAEDETTLDAMATCVDLALLDPATKVAVLRGGPVEPVKYGGRRVFGAGINLTHLYQGRIPYLWYLERDLGYVHKIYRGLAYPDARPDDVHGETLEKPWIAAVEGFAIGGHCQLLLAADYIIAQRDAYLTLPARKEGIIPGMANLRCRASSATGSPAKRSSTSGASIATRRRAG